MIYFKEAVKILLPQKTISHAKEFAEAVVQTIDYSDSNQSIRKKIEEDHFISKLGEVAVASHYKFMGCQVEGPDFTIYLGDYKSWESDLIIDGIPLAVKTQKRSSAKKYGLSWTFQSSGQRRDPILDKPDAWVIFVECNDEDDFSCILFPPKQMKDLILSEPKLKHLVGKKKVFYLNNENSKGNKSFEK